MPRIAIDVVLLPPDMIMKEAIEMNRKFGDDSLVLDLENCLPHISLCMGTLEEESWPQVRAMVNELSRGFAPLQLDIESMGGKKAWFNIRKTDELYRLHEALMECLEPYLAHSATRESCCEPPAVSDSTLAWINAYRQECSFERFIPHITLGRSVVPYTEMLMQFTASRLAICHLGEHCTCRRVLYEVSLA